MITKLFKAKVIDGFIAIATQSNQHQTGCHTNCKPVNKSLPPKWQNNNFDCISIKKLGFTIILVLFNIPNKLYVYH